MKRILLTLLILFVFVSPVKAADTLANVRNVSIDTGNIILIGGIFPCSDYVPVYVMQKDTVNKIARITVYAHDTHPEMDCALLPTGFNISIPAPFPAGTYRLIINGVAYRSWG